MKLEGIMNLTTICVSMGTLILAVITLITVIRKEN